MYPLCLTIILKASLKWNGKSLKHHHSYIEVKSSIAYYLVTYDLNIDTFNTNFFKILIFIKIYSKINGKVFPLQHYFN